LIRDSTSPDASGCNAGVKHALVVPDTPNAGSGAIGVVVTLVVMCAQVVSQSTIVAVSVGARKERFGRRMLGVPALDVVHRGS
jgi:hypothetical protein